MDRAILSERQRDHESRTIKRPRSGLDDSFMIRSSHVDNICYHDAVLFLSQFLIFLIRMFDFFCSKNATLLAGKILRG